jgi:hypothetical protein
MKGTIRRAAAAAPSSPRVDGSAMLTAEPTSMHSVPAQKPPPNPTRASSQKINMVRGG